MEDGSLIAGSVLFIYFWVMNFILYAFSSALTTTSEATMHEQAEDGDEKSKNIADIMERPKNFVNALRIHLFILIALGSVFLLPFFAKAIASWLLCLLAAPYAVHVYYIIGYLIAGGFLGFLIISISIIIPKRMGAKNADKWVFSLYKPARFCTVFWTPLRYIYSHAANRLLLCFGIHPKDEFENMTEDEIKSIVNEGHEQGVIESSEAEMIANIFEFGDKEAQDIMTHRKSIVAIDGNTSLDEAVDFILKENKTRYPVYVDDIDDIIGILHLKDLMIVNEKLNVGDKPIKDIEGLIRKAEFIPETRHIDVLFKNMQTNKIHMVVVIDEYGQTSGIITMEDVVEEIVGNILDEYDEEEKNILASKDNIYVVNGLTPLDELEEVTRIHFEEEDCDTINGFLMSHLDHIPKENERPQIEVDGILYKVLSVENKTISRVKITIPRNNQTEKTVKEEKEN